MASDNKPKQAAISLGRHLANKSWYSSVGIGREAGKEILIIYATRALSKDRERVPETWEGLPVRIRYLGRILPARNAA
jgi:hypothetical protein